MVLGKCARLRLLHAIVQNDRARHFLLAGKDQLKDAIRVPCSILRYNGARRQGFSGEEIVG